MAEARSINARMGHVIAMPAGMKAPTVAPVAAAPAAAAAAEVEEEEEDDDDDVVSLLELERR